MFASLSIMGVGLYLTMAIQDGRGIQKRTLLLGRVLDFHGLILSDSTTVVKEKPIFHNLVVIALENMTSA
jgi:hypothetical protein